MSKTLNAATHFWTERSNIMDGTSNLGSTSIQLPPLPYPLEALEPHISRETLGYHHGKHHRGYVTKLNELIRGTKHEGWTLDQLVKGTSGAVFNNAAQVWNHSFYWSCLSPEGGGVATGDLGAAIDASYGAFENFAAKFKRQALAKFGSGWTWLVRARDGSLRIVNTNDADNPLVRGETPLLTCDVWEHAYYIDYRNNRAEYVAAFFSLIDWSRVAANFRDAGQPRQDAGKPEPRVATHAGSLERDAHMGSRWT
jgi:Fe-Mn family superoxide dismutase